MIGRFGRRLTLPGVALTAVLLMGAIMGFNLGYQADTLEEARISPDERQEHINDALEDEFEPPWYNEYLPEQFQREPAKPTGWQADLISGMVGFALTVASAISVWAFNNQWFPMWAAQGLTFGGTLAMLAWASYTSYTYIRGVAEVAR